MSTKMIIFSWKYRWRKRVFVKRTIFGLKTTIFTKWLKIISKSIFNWKLYFLKKYFLSKIRHFTKTRIIFDYLKNRNQGNYFYDFWGNIDKKILIFGHFHFNYWATYLFRNSQSSKPTTGSWKYTECSISNSW